MTGFTSEDVTSKVIVLSLRVLLVILYIIWLHLVCKLPFNWADSNVRYVYPLSAAVLISLVSLVIDSFLPSIPALHLFIDSFLIIGCYVAAGWHPRYVYGRQLEQTLHGIEKSWKLKLSWMMVLVVSPLTCVTLMMDNYYLKYGSWDVVIGKAPWDRVDEVKMSLTGVGITIGCALVIVSYQLYMFYVALSHLRLDYQKQRALRMILTSYLISLTGNNILGIFPNFQQFFYDLGVAMVLNDSNLSNWVGVLNDIGIVVAPLLPLFVKRFVVLERILMKGIQVPPRTQTDVTVHTKTSQGTLLRNSASGSKDCQH